jgi:DNA-binding NtrC family response regulator
VADVLIVEDKQSLREVLRRTLELRGLAVAEAADAYEARRRLLSERFLVVLTDLRLPGGSGFDVLAVAREADAELPVIVMTAYGTIEDAVKAMKEGAADFLTKPVDTDHLVLILERALERRRLTTDYILLREEYQRRFGLPRVLGEDAGLKETLLAVQRAATSDATVLLLGESGTGKELLARALHQLSARAKGPFVAINCAAIPADLLEAEMFGIGKGIATGVVERRGKFQMAEGGTLLLDEIGDMPHELQAKLLRALQEKEVQPVGGAPVPVDIRVIAATNSDLHRRMEEGRFRRDLYFRVAGFALRVPPLRERREDIPALVESFMRAFARETGKGLRGITVKALRALIEYDWPGNVRELQLEVRRLVY